MGLIGLYSVLLLIYIGQTKIISSSSQYFFKDSVGFSQYDIQPLSIYPCEDKDIQDTLFEYTATLQDKGGDKSLDFEITFDEPLNRDFGVSFQVDRKKDNGGDGDGEWEENVFSGEGHLCDYLEKFAKTAWAKLRKAVDPPVESVCDWPAGTFKAKDFGVLATDYTIPLTEHGQLRVVFKVFNPEGDLVFCHRMEADTF